MTEIELTQNVRDFIDQTGCEIGKFAAFEYDIDMFFTFRNNNISSPIEQILYCALIAISRFNYMRDSITILPQFSIGEYRVDFLVSYIGGEERQTIIECDSQQFHDRAEPERRYEKKRDRFLQSKGYKVFRFTGSEITKNPMEIAAEIISFITNDPIENIALNSCLGD